MTQLKDTLVNSNLTDDDAPKGLSNVIEKHLRSYFAAHKGCLPSHGLYERILKEVERPLLNTLLDVVEGNQLQAAQILGLNRNTLRKKLKELNIDPKKR